MATNNSVDTTLSGQTGTGSFVGSNSPTLITPTLGAAGATSINFGGASLATYSGLTAWTPVFTFATPGNLSVSYAVQNGWYSRIGNIVTVNFSLTATPTFTTASGIALVTGLPFTSNSATENTTVGAVYIENIIITPFTYVVSSIDDNSSFIVFSGCMTGAAAGNLSPGSFTSGVSMTMISTLTYFV